MINKKMILLYLSSAIILLFTLNIFAEENIFYHGMRPMVMGGAFVAVGDDYNSRNWNPASLATQESWDITLEDIPRVSKDISDELIDASQGKGLINDSQKAFDKVQTDSQGLIDTVDKIQAKKLEGGNELYLGFSIRPWKFAFGVSSNIFFRTYIIKSPLSELSFLKLYNWIDNKVVYNATADLVPQISKAYTIKELIPVPNFLSEGDTADRDLNIGFNFKLLQRIRYSNEDNPFAFTDLISEEKRKAASADLPSDFNKIPVGTGFGMDVGTIVKLNDYLNFGLNVQDIGLSKIKYETGKDFTSKDEEFPTNVRLGAALKPLRLMGYKKTKAIDMTLSADLDNLNGKVRDNKDFVDKTHVGFETKFSLWRDFLGLGLRVGANQGFPSYGITVNGLWFFSLQASMYGTDVTDYVNASASVVF